jgi:hypothetical protein
MPGQRTNGGVYEKCKMKFRVFWATMEAVRTSETSVSINLTT